MSSPWKNVKLSDVNHLLTRGISPKYTDNGYAVVNQRCIRDGVIDYTHARFSSKSKKIREDKFIHKWDVLVNSTGVGTLGRLAQVLTENENMTVDSHVTIVRPNTDVLNGRYFGYAMAWKQSEIEALGTGATGQIELSRTALGDVLIPLPSIPLQNRIADILSAYDDLIENNRRRIKILKEMTQNLYREWFVKYRFPIFRKDGTIESIHNPESDPMQDSELGLIPEQWEIKKLVELSAFLNRGISPKYDDLSTSRVINQKCIRDFRLDMDLCRKQSKAFPEAKQIVIGDVLVNSTGVGTLGRAAQVLVDCPDCTVDSHVTIVRPNNSVTHEYFGELIKSLQATIENMGAGATGQTELSRTRLGEINILYPNIITQRKFSEIVMPMKSHMSSLILKSKILTRTRELLIPKLITGEIKVNELSLIQEKII